MQAVWFICTAGNPTLRAKQILQEVNYANKIT